MGQTRPFPGHVVTVYILESVTVHSGELSSITSDYYSPYTLWNALKYATLPLTKDYYMVKQVTSRLSYCQ